METKTKGTPTTSDEYADVENKCARPGITPVLEKLIKE